MDEPEETDTHEEEVEESKEVETREEDVEEPLKGVEQEEMCIRDSTQEVVEGLNAEYIKVRNKN